MRNFFVCILWKKCDAIRVFFQLCASFFKLLNGGE